MGIGSQSHPVWEWGTKILKQQRRKFGWMPFLTTNDVSGVQTQDLYTSLPNQQATAAPYVYTQGAAEVIHGYACLAMAQQYTGVHSHSGVYTLIYTYVYTTDITSIYTTDITHVHDFGKVHSTQQYGIPHCWKSHYNIIQHQVKRKVIGKSFGLLKLPVIKRRFAERKGSRIMPYKDKLKL